MDWDLVATPPRQRSVDLARSLQALGARARRASPRALAAAVVCALLVVGGAVAGLRAAVTTGAARTPGILADGLAGPPTRLEALRSAGPPRPTTVEDYEMVRAARF